MHKKTCLIVPCYNEEKRLDIAAFRDYPGDCHFLFVDDGSTDRTAEIIRPYIGDRIALLELKANSGKGEAVRRGMLYALEALVLRESEWFGYWDADLATPLDELEMFFGFAALYPGGIDAIWGSRVYRLGSSIERDWRRHIAGRAFATAAGLLLGIKTYDSQCGAKLFRKALIPVGFSQAFLSQWLFDIELLLRLKTCRMIECPLLKWQDQPESKFKLVSYLPRIFLDLVRIRSRYAKMI